MQIFDIIKQSSKIILYPISLFYSIIVFFRNFFYNIGLFSTYRLPCIVISVGNVSIGGTGKTPIVASLANLLTKHGKKTAIISRGYLRKTKGTVLVSDGKNLLCEWHECGDEAYMLGKKLTNIPIVVDEKRYRGGHFIIKQFKPDIIILDDGFQHRQLFRDLDIITINANEKFKNYTMIPKGNLREPFNNIGKRADLLLITKGIPDINLTSKLNDISLPLFNTKIKAYITTNQRNKEVFQKGKVFLLSGIADPYSFKKTALSLGLKILGQKSYPDHFPFKKTHISKAENRAKEIGAEYIVTTEKDWVRILPLKPNYKYAIIKIELKIVEEKNFINLISKKLNLGHTPSKDNTNKS